MIEEQCGCHIRLAQDVGFERHQAVIEMCFDKDALLAGFGLLQDAVYGLADKVQAMKLVEGLVKSACRWSRCCLVSYPQARLQHRCYSCSESAQNAG